MGQAVSDVLPLAVGVMISPIPIVAVILMLFTPRAHSNGPSFLAGWVGGLAIAAGVVYAIADGLDVATDSGASDGASTLKLVLGIALVLMGVRRWRNRPAPDAEVSLPAWMQAIDRITPGRALGLGVLLSALNPKNLLLTIGAATAVAQLGVSTSDAVVALAVFVVVASASIAVPVAIYLFAQARAQAILDTWKTWLQDNNATVMAVLLVVIGVALFSQGLGPLTT